ncbi:ATP-binding protein [Candidatus Riflebacteria bacterium]
MEKTDLETLKAAVEASPENHPLLLLYLKSALESESFTEAHSILTTRAPYTAFVNTEDRLLAAKICLGADDAELTLKFADSEVDESLLLQAKAYLALNKKEKGLLAYEKAVELNPTLEDNLLKAQLHAKEYKVTATNSNKVRKLRVISNDDTDETEIMRLTIPQPEEVRFEHVGGLNEIKKQINRKIILPFQKPSLFQRFKKKVGGGILLYGPPGCGKTLLARATAGECNARFFNVAISDILDMYIGESERKLHAIFEKCRTQTPAVLFFDELEALAGKRQYTRESTSSKIVSLFLSEMDGYYQNNQGVLILAATNVPWVIDPAFRRPGRFDRVLFVPPPDREAREKIIRIQLEDLPIQENIDYAFLAKSSSGFSGADLQNLVDTASDMAIEASLDSGKEEALQNSFLFEALRQVKPTTTEWLTTARNYARYANEAGQYDDVLDFLKKFGKGGN